MSNKVTVLQLRRGVMDLQIEAGSTVEELLAAAEIPLEGMEVRVNGEPVAADGVVGEGALVTVVPLIKGGLTAR